jgi:polyhydroxyalkanoate synthesis regulator phasin
VIKKRNPKGFYDVDGVPMISSTTVLKRLEKEALHPWIAKQTAEQIRDFILQPIIRGEITPLQLSEMNLDDVMRQAKEASTKAKRQAGDMGSLIHKVIEEYYHTAGDHKILDNYTKTIPELTSPILAFMEWEKTYEVEPRYSEETVYSEVHGYAGTLDLFCLVTIPGEEGRKEIVVDFKSSSGVYDEHIMQLASYVFAKEEMIMNSDPQEWGFLLSGAMIVRLDKETGICEPHYYTREELLIPFQAFVKVKEFCELDRTWRLIRKEAKKK